jgi:pilus assembly protein CpaF
MTLEKLINPMILDSRTRLPVLDEDGQPKRKYKNAEVPFKLIQYLMMGQVTCGFTGRQGSGKTTMMKYALGSADGRLTLRILEMTAELYLREVFFERNILSVQETAWCTPSELQDALKKSDAAISIVGEVATDAVAARMIQMGQVASIFTIFSHHANRTEDLVQALTNSIVASSHGAATPDTVEPQVIDVIKVDVHLDYDVDGNRYIERITEIVRTENNLQYSKVDTSDPMKSMAENQRIFFEKSTESRRFITRNILHFDLNTWTYVTDWFFSESLTNHILSRLPKEYVNEFIDFAEENWRNAPAG